MKQDNINDRYLSLTDGAKYLMISKSSMQKISANLELPRHKPKGKVYYLREDLDNYLSSARIGSRAEIEAKIHLKKNEK